MVMFSMGLKTWAFIILWFLLAPIAQKLDLGPIYVSDFHHLPIFYFNWCMNVRAIHLPAC